jgi:hypothetical protein
MKKPFTEHPQFHPAGLAANDGLTMMLHRLGLNDADLYDFDVTANRVVDDLTKLLLRAYDAKQKKVVRSFDQQSSQDTPGFVETFRVMP